MARRTGRAKPMTPKAGVTKTHRRYSCGGIYNKITDVFYKHDRAAK